MILIYDPNTQYLSPKLSDIFKYGYSYVIVYKDALKIPILLDKTSIFSKDDNRIVGALSLNDISTILGKSFEPVPKMADGYYLVHVSFDEKLINGKREQDLLKALLEAYGYKNIRDLNNDGLNDTEIEDLDGSVINSVSTPNFLLAL